MSRRVGYRQGALGRAILMGVALAAAPSPPLAQDWNPFKNDGPIPVPQRPVRADPKAEPPPAAWGQSPASASGTWDDAPPADPQAAARSGPITIEQGELAPVAVAPVSTAPQGSEAPLSPQPVPSAPVAGPVRDIAWQGIDAKGLGELLAGVELPAKSPAMARLFAQALGAQLSLRGAPAPQPGNMDAFRAEGLQRAGRLRAALQLVERADLTATPIAAAERARLDIAVGDQDRGCRTAQQLSTGRTELPANMRGEMILIVGYCAARAGNPAAAGIAAGLAREDGQSGWAVDALETIAASDKPSLKSARRIGPLEYRLYAVGLGDDFVTLLEKLEPASLALLADEADIDPRLKMAAVEASARLNVIDPDRLAELWRQQAFSPAELGAGSPERVSPLLRRAFLFKVAEGERNPAKRTRAIRALLDDTRRTGLYFASLRALGGAAAQIQPVPEVGWFAETGIEIALASSDYENARRWARLGSGPDRPATQQLDYWLALIDVADPALKTGRGQSLGSVEALALHGRFATDLLHRLATVLDALDYNVPIPLWDAASRAPQPTTGYLPATGVLAELATAAKAHEEVRTVVLSLRAMGSGAADSLNILVLGDVIRALKRTGFEAEARQLGLEALLAAWPRVSGS